MVASYRQAQKAAIPWLFVIGICNLRLSRPIFHPAPMEAFVPAHKFLPTDILHHETTIIISSSLVPSHPSLTLIDQTITSLQHHIQGLPPQTPIIITIDGVYRKGRDTSSTNQKSDQKSEILNEYVHALRTTYNESHITILPQKTKINLVGNVRKAMQQVDTEFVYIIQHDMPFISPIDHKALVQTFRDYPREVRLVRFSPRTTLSRNRDKMGLCGMDLGLEANGIALAKTHTWSDNNHFTRKSYYDEMFSTIEGWDTIHFMETKMVVLGEKKLLLLGNLLVRGTG